MIIKTLIILEKMDILDAIYQNDIEKVRELAPQQWNITEYGPTPLEYANKLGRQECIDILALYGNIIRCYDHSPLVDAIFHDLVDKVKLLLESGENPNIISNLYHLCLGTKNETIIQLLLENTPNFYDSISPLDIAILKENETIIELLVHYGAILNMYKTLSTVIDHNKMAIIMIFFKHNYPLGSQPLYYAIEKNDVDIVKLLIEYKVPLNHALHIASRNKNMEMVQLLLDNKANLNELDDEGNTPIMSTRSMKMMRFLVDKGADVSIVNAEGNSLLHNVVFFGKDKIIKLLVEKGCDINSQNNKGKTALHKAVRYRSLETMELLLSLDADPLITNKKGKTAKDIVLGWKSTLDGWDEDWIDEKTKNKYETLLTKYEEFPMIKGADF